MELKDHGAIKRILLPANWERLPDEDYLIKYCRADDKEISLNFYYRGKPISDHIGTKFQALLTKAPHILTPEELHDLEVVIRDASEHAYFNLSDAQTQMLNERMIYVVHGHWKLSNLDSLGIFLDSDADGKTIDEIYYLAPPDKFGQHLDEIQRAFDSIEWNDS